jgi:hypothetical protein
MIQDRPQQPILKPNPQNPVTLAARQGFDDGYFRNDEERREFETEAERVAYDTEFAIGRRQRKEAARAARKAKAKR